MPGADRSVAPAVPELADAARTAALHLLRTVDGPARARAALPWADETSRRWIEYRPRPRPGVSLAELDTAGRKAAHRLPATGLSEVGYAQAMVALALEEVLDRREGWRRHRHSADFWVCVFGTPDGADPWGWRFEGHHLSVSVTVHGDRVSADNLFNGANPPRVT